MKRGGGRRGRARGKLEGAGDAVEMVLEYVPGQRHAERIFASHRDTHSASEIANHNLDCRFLGAIYSVRVVPFA